MEIKDSCSLFVATTVDRDMGGIARSVPALAGSYAAALEGIQDVRLLVPEAAEDTLDPGHAIEGLTVCRCSPGDSMIQSLDKVMGSASRPIPFIYHAGVWDPLNHAVAKLARRRKIPLVVSTRSMLDPWALNHRKWKKRLAWWVYGKRDLSGAALIHATAELEAGYIRKALGSACPPIIVVPNGVELPDESITGSKRGTREHRRLLFLSRIHPKKGVLDLIKAFGEIDPQGWELVIAGNDDGGHQAVCEKLATHQVNADRITFTGAVSDVDKWDVYRSADLFVLPSYSENFGIVIGEAMGMGIPVITTTATPWSGVGERECGWLIEPGSNALIPALKNAMELSDEDRMEMGERGSQWIRSEFTWESIGRQFVEALRAHGLL